LVRVARARELSLAPFTIECRPDDVVVWRCGPPQRALDVIEVSEDWGWARGHWGASSSNAEGAVTHQQGKWINIFQRGADGWKTKINLWNLDSPPAPAAGE
jgi:ketosteroid isomerase-like protein